MLLSKLPFSKSVTVFNYLITKKSLLAFRPLAERLAERSFGQRLVRPAFGHSVTFWSVFCSAASIRLSVSFRPFGQLLVIRPFGHSVIRPFGHSAIRLFGHSAIRSFRSVAVDRSLFRLLAERLADMIFFRPQP